MGDFLKLFTKESALLKTDPIVLIIRDQLRAASQVSMISWRRASVRNGGCGMSVADAGVLGLIAELRDRDGLVIVVSLYAAVFKEVDGTDDSSLASGFSWVVVK